MGGIVEMIDLHSHLLPGLDDGAKTLDESVQMCWISYQDGVRTIVATPHTLNGLYFNNRETILLKVQELNETLTQCGMRNAECGIRNSKSQIESSSVNSAIRDPCLSGRQARSAITLNSALRTPQSAIRVLPGSDVRLCENTLAHLDQGKVMTVSDSKKYLFLEFPFHAIPYQAEEIIFQIMTRGIIPIITHPERNPEIAERPQRYFEMIRMGCLGQVTAMSLTGEFGSRMRQTAERLLKKRLIHFIASDAHSIDGRPPILSEGVRAAEKIVGKEEAQKMVTEYPQAIVEGRKPNVPEPIAP
jgi:protein-tyrosine phosphatase